MTDAEKLLDHYDALLRESYRLAGHHNGFGSGKPAPHRERVAHNQKVQAARAELVKRLSILVD